MRYARAIDENHGDTMNAFRALGCDVVDLSRAGDGIPDMLVTLQAWSGEFSFFVEVKDGTKPPSARRLTPAQVAFREEHPRVKVAEILCLEDVTRLVRNLRQPWRGVA